MNLPEDNTVWVPSVIQVGEADSILGGALGIDNAQAQAFANRTAYLLRSIGVFDASPAPLTTGGGV